MTKGFTFAPCLLLASCLAFNSCGNVNDFPEFVNVMEELGGVTEGEQEKVLVDNIKIDETPLTGETEDVPAVEQEGYKDFIEYFKYDDEVHAFEGSQDWNDEVRVLEIEFSEGDATLNFTDQNGDPVTPARYTKKGITVTQDGAHLTIKATKKIHYILKGKTTDGSLKLYNDKRSIVELAGVSLASKHGPAINIQKGIEGGKRAFFLIADGTRNYLSDGAVDENNNYVGTTVAYNPYSGEQEQEKGAIFSENKIIFLGNGYLHVEAKGKHGIASDDYVYVHKGPQITVTSAPNHHGIKGNDAIYIAGGVLNITCSGAASRGLTTDGDVNITGGRTIVISTATKKLVTEDNSYSYPYCIKADNSFTMSAGELRLSASASEDGNGIKSQQISFLGGIAEIIAKLTPLNILPTISNTTLYLNNSCISQAGIIN